LSVLVGSELCAVVAVDDADGGVFALPLPQPVAEIANAADTRTLIKKRLIAP